MTDLGEALYLLGIAITWDQNDQTLHLSQSTYSKDILKHFSINESKPVSTLMDTLIKLRKSKKSKNTENYTSIPYCQAVGLLMYLMLGTRPDISYVVNNVAQYSSYYDNMHWSTIKHIFMYI